jgi:hypothetical protein
MLYTKIDDQESNKIMVSLSLAESAMIKKLRKFDYGKFTIYKQKGEPKRIEMLGSEMIEDADGLSLAENLIG